MPVYEILLRQPNLPQKVSFANRQVTEIGDLVTFNNSQWIDVGKEPPFELRRIERLVCHQAEVLPQRRFAQ
jgi:hypothetical protein